jgi:hypothetical protein
MRRTAAQHGPEAVAFSQSSGSTTAIADSAPFIRRLMNAFGKPNLVWPLDLCSWGRGFATRYVYDVGSVAIGSAGGVMPDIAETGCLILRGVQPILLAHYTCDRRSRFQETLDPVVVVGEHGWWLGCGELGIPESDPTDPTASNFNLTVNAEMRDPISGTPSHRSNFCDVRAVEQASAFR